MNFENMKCDGCGRVFEKDDDVVVCPECGTPQHRRCYELCGGCVNSGKHKLGFEWQKENLPEKAENNFKAENEAQGNITQSRQDIPPRSGFFGNMDPGIGDSIDPNGELPRLDDLIESRVKALAPGITPEQRSERLCGAELGTTISFIGSNAAVYVKKFRKREHENKHTFNWAAFFFTPYWFFYRKLYKAGAIYISLLISLTMLAVQPVEDAFAIYDGILQSGATTIADAQYSQLMTAMIPVIIIEALMFLIHLVAGFTADKMYWNHCRKSLERVEELRRGDEVSALECYLKRCSTSFLMGLVAILAYSFLPQLLISLFG